MFRPLQPEWDSFVDFNRYRVIPGVSWLPESSKIVQLFFRYEQFDVDE